MIQNCYLLELQVFTKIDLSGELSCNKKKKKKVGEFEMFLFCFTLSWIVAGIAVQLHRSE